MTQLELQTVADAGCVSPLSANDAGCVAAQSDIKVTAAHAPQHDEGAGALPAEAAAADSAPTERPTRRQFERALRELGLSRREAETFTRAGLAAIEQPALPASDELDSLRSLILRNTQILKKESNV